MPKEDNEILKYNHGENSLKVPFIIHASLENFSTCHNPKKSSTAKINIHPLVIHCSHIAHLI